MSGFLLLTFWFGIMALGTGAEQHSLPGIFVGAALATFALWLHKFDGEPQSKETE